MVPVLFSLEDAASMFSQENFKFRFIWSQNSFPLSSVHFKWALAHRRHQQNFRIMFTYDFFSDLHDRIIPVFNAMLPKGPKIKSIPTFVKHVAAIKLYLSCYFSWNSKNLNIWCFSCSYVDKKYGSVQITAFYFDLLFTENPNLFKTGVVIINIFSALLVLQTQQNKKKHKAICSFFPYLNSPQCKDPNSPSSNS